MENQVPQPKEGKRFGCLHLIGGIILLFIIFIIIAGIGGEKKEDVSNQSYKSISKPIEKEEIKWGRVLNEEDKFIACDGACKLFLNIGVERYDICVQYCLELDTLEEINLFEEGMDKLYYEEILKKAFE